MHFSTKRKVKPAPNTNWHRWFAWRPVFTQDKYLVWLELVWRKSRRIHIVHPGGGEFGPYDYETWVNDYRLYSEKAIEER